jgi:dTDP-4-amino-4,6-dideoxygalactose transaminase
MSNVPLVDLGWQRDQIADDVEAGFARVLEKTAFINGPDVKAFEEEFAQYSGVARCVGVGNGTDAIELGLRALGIGNGDEVIIPANTFIATAEAVGRAGALPVLVDQDDESFLIDTDLAAEAIGAKTAAIIGVHLYGQIAPLDRLSEVAAANDVVLFEDAAQAQGATRHDKGIGAFSRVASTSFYPGKNLGAYGDGGAVLTNDEAIADMLDALRDHGSTAKYQHDYFGTNSRLDTIQAVVLRAKLARLDDWNKLRVEVADRYEGLLADVDGVTTPKVLDGNAHVWHLYVVRVAERDRVLAELNENGVGAGIHYPTPVHLHPAFDDLGLRAGTSPVAEACADEILSLPLFPGMTADQQDRVVEVLTNAL